MTRQIILFIHSSLNSIVTGDPATDATDFVAWTRPGNIIEPSEALVALFDNRVDTILFGRRTYEDLVRKWPTMQGPPDGDDVVSRLARRINAARKLVATRNPGLSELPWGSFAPAETLVGDDVTEQLRQLKGNDGGDIVIFGSPALSRSLIEQDLIDEFHILTHPVFVEAGERLLEDVDRQVDLSLTDITTFSEGGVLASYARVDP